MNKRYENEQEHEQEQEQEVTLHWGEKCGDCTHYNGGTCDREGNPVRSDMPKCSWFHPW